MKLHFTYFLAVAILVTFNNNTFSMQATQKQSRWSLASIAEFFGYYRSRPEDVTVMHSLSKMYTAIKNGSRLYVVDPEDGTIYVVRKRKKILYHTHLVPTTEPNEKYVFISLDGKNTPLKEVPDTNRVSTAWTDIKIYTTGIIPNDANECDSAMRDTLLSVGRKLNQEALDHKSIQWNLIAPTRFPTNIYQSNNNVVCSVCEIALKKSMLCAYYKQHSHYASTDNYVKREAI